MHKLDYVMFVMVKLWCQLVLLCARYCADKCCLAPNVVPTSVA